jgi:hypothetical protein
MRFLIIVTTVSLLLTGCDTAKDAFGLSRSQPDEFAVTDNPPLTIPKEFQVVPPIDMKKNKKRIDPSQAALNVLKNENCG